MMKGKIFQLIFAIAIFGGLGYFLYHKVKDDNSVLSDTAQDMVKSVSSDADASKIYNSDLIPTTELLDGRTPLATKVYAELKVRYKKYFEELVKEIKSTGAVPVLCWVTTEDGNAQTAIQYVGKAYIKQLCVEYGVDFEELSGPILSNMAPYTFMPKDGHFNKLGASVVARMAEGIIAKNAGARCKVTYTDKERSEFFGDQLPNDNEILDGGKGLPYKLKTNKQGLRMNYDLSFPKKKRRILFIGDSGFFFPFLDNDATAEGMVQSRHPELEVLNAANWGYSIDDYLSLWKERAKYAEPDVILLQTSGSDITDLFFTNRMKYSRHHEHIQPSALEKEFYEYLDKKAKKH